MSFCTAINCMDGRVQMPVIQYLKRRFEVEFVDVITEPGPNAILASGADAGAMESIRRRLRISVERHKSVGIAVAGHHDCAGNPAGPTEHAVHTLAAVRHLQEEFPSIPVIGLWVNEAWQVSELL